VLVFFVVSWLAAAAAHAGDPKLEINLIKSEVDASEKAISEKNVNSAKVHLGGAKNALAKASQGAKDMPDFAALQARYDALTKKLDALAADSDKASAAKRDLEQADEDFRFSRTKELDEGVPLLKSCLDHLKAAVDANPSLEKDAAPLRKNCEDALAKVSKSGGRTSPDETDGGKAAKAAYVRATELAAKKDLDAFGLAEAQKATADCDTQVGGLTSQFSSSGQRVYEPTKATLTLPSGPITLDQLKDKCFKLGKQLATRKVAGCGTASLSLMQKRISVNPERFGKAETMVADTFTPVKCADMPKTDSIGGLAKTFAGQLKSACKGAAQINADDWGSVSESGYRTLEGTCYRKGMLNFAPQATSAF
jgi:hypothetical protein